MPAPRAVPTDLHAVLNEALALYQGLLGEVRFERRFAEKLPKVRVDSEQIRRVIINLVDNAIEAMNRSGVITLETHHDPSASLVRLIVTDDGPGIPAAEREKLFMPYYSTKRRGSGLGLAIVRRIVAEHGGTIEVGDNEPQRHQVHNRAAMLILFRLDAKTPSREGYSIRQKSLSALCAPALSIANAVNKASILIVDDEPGVRSALSGVLRDEGYTVDAVESGEQCLDRVVREVFDVIVLDVWLPGLDGLATLGRLRQMKVDSQVVMISGHGNIESAVKAIKTGAFDFVEKPLSLEKTVLVVRNALRQRHLEAENRALRARVDRDGKMVGESLIMRQLREQVAMAAPTNGRVLIFGENGTGKELVARTVHALSRRRNQPFVEVNCAAIPEELIESELFGHVKGAFTGAVADRKGRFEAAHTGTIFLDEIGDMSLKTQAKVLRVLQEQVTEPVGSTSRVQVDVRVLAATNKDLQAEIRGGQFPRGPVFPAERHSDFRAAAARARGRHPAARRAFRRRLRARVRKACEDHHARGDGSIEDVSVARQHARAAERHRAGRHHGAGRRDHRTRSRVPGRRFARREAGG